MTKPTSRAGSLMESLGGVSDFSRNARRSDGKPPIFEARTSDVKPPAFISEAARIKVGDTFGDWAVASYEPLTNNTLGGTDGGKLQLARKDTDETILVEYDPQREAFFATVDHKQLKAKTMALALKKVVKELGADESGDNDFDNDEKFVEYILDKMPKELKSKGHVDVYVKPGFGGSNVVTVRYLSNDYLENPKLHKVEMNALHRLVFIMHHSPETRDKLEPMHFELATSIHRKVKSELKAPRLTDQKTFRAAADKLVAWFKKNEKRLLDWSENL